MGTKQPVIATAIARAAYPKHIIFEEQDGIFWLRGEDLVRAKKVLALDCNGDAVGFDAATVSEYANLLIKKGMKVGLLRGSAIQTIRCQRPKRPAQVLSTTIGLAPELLVDKEELVCLASSKKMKSPAMQEMLAAIKETLQRGERSGLSAYGTIYVFQVAEDMYEVDDELTTVPKELLDVLLVATDQTGRMLRCQLVEPKGRRRNRHISNKRTQITVSQPVTYGQLSFNL